MTNDSDEAGGTLFLTVDAILTEHERLLAAQSDHQDILQIRSFVDRLTESGAYFDEAFERKAIQGTLDYWTSELARHQTDEEPAGQRRRVIREFSAKALQDLQRDFENPFAGISNVIGSLPKEERNSAAILRVVDKTAKAGNLRFQEGLLKELVSQVTGSREDATLLEFCLWHLFEDAETRSGNKIYRPKKSRNKDERVDFFSCKVFLVRKADELYEALFDSERDALVDALMSMTGSNTNAQRPRSLLRSLMAKVEDISESVQARFRSTPSEASQFALYDKKPLTLTEFLEPSRLAFCEGGKWRIVHPALAERWDPLKKRKWEVEQKAKRNEAHVFMISTGAVAALVTSLAWIAWYVVWTHLAMQHLASAQTSTDPKERLSESVAGLWASKLSMGVDESYAREVANDAIGAVIGLRARKGTLGKLAAYPSVPGIECQHNLGPSGSESYSLTITSESATQPRLRALDTCPIFAANPDGTLLAAAWEKKSGVDVKVFRIRSPNFQLGSGKDGTLVEADLKEDDAEWMKTEAVEPLKLAQPLREESKKRGAKECKDRSLRFSQDDTTVTFECLYAVDSGSELEWIPRSLESSSSGPASNVAGNVFDAMQKLVIAAEPPSNRAASVFLGPRSGSKLDFVTVRGDGYVQIWHYGKEQPSLSDVEFRSDFVRVGTGGRPTALDVQHSDDHHIYAIYALNPYPVIRVYEQRYPKHATLLMEHYPPSGVGTPVGIKFTTKARCLQILAKRKNINMDKLELVDYYLVLDPDRLRAVGKALSKDIELEPPVSTSGLPKYTEAIRTQCYGV